jgi:hypothetical protein
MAEYPPKKRPLVLAKSKPQAAAALKTLLKLPTRVFISFDYDHDRTAATFLGQQLRSSPRFTVENWSMKEAAPEHLWKDEARKRINRSDVVLVVVGRHTHRAVGVLEEVKMAREAKPPVPLRQVVGYRDLIAPARVPDAGRLYRWKHDTLATILTVPRRKVIPAVHKTP